MKIKSYFARAVEDAMAMARQELGPEAMLLNTKKASPEARHMGEYEVAFAVPQSDPARIEAGDTEAGGSDRLSVEVAELRRQLEGMRRTIARSALASPQWVGPSPDVTDLYASLYAAEMPPDVAREIAQAAEVRVTGGRALRAGTRLDRNALYRALVDELTSRFTVQPSLGSTAGGPRIAALVGPPGSGKTTTVAKLAVHYGLTSRRPVLLISADNYRVAGCEQLRSFAAILGVPFQALDTVAALAQALEENNNKDLILIDTPGFGFPDLEQAGDLARFLSTRPGIDTHLVLTASMKSADLSRVIDAFEIFRPAHLLFTKLDETSSFGPLFHEAARTGKPLSFLGTGQRIPEDLEAAEKSRLTELILAGRSGEVLSAA